MLALAGCGKVAAPATAAAGFRSYLGYLPEEDLAVVVLSNGGAADSWAVGEAILRAVLRARE